MCRWRKSGEETHKEDRAVVRKRRGDNKRKRCVASKNTDERRKDIEA